jgi:hypothetical protein
MAYVPNTWKGLDSPYAVNWAGRPLPPTRAPINSLSDWPPQISPGAPEEGMYDALAPVNGYPGEGLVTGIRNLPAPMKLALAGGAVFLIWKLFLQKKSGGNLVGRSIRLKSIAAR